jgi:ubiquinone/menaquinone biosynthesis C-methylase UbiE
MKTEWDYTELAQAYVKRPDYSDDALSKMLDIIGISGRKEAKICDVGAGVGHLTIKLAEKKYTINAVEPNDAMRKLGIERTKHFDNVTWSEGTGEETGQSENSFDLVSFGSSFNVTNRQKALIETARILKPNGWFACMWNHRNLKDSLQKKIEDAISSKIKEYSYGSRREDQTEHINQSSLFKEVIQVEGTIIHQQSKEDCIEAWRSHGTLHRQAGEKFDSIINDISNVLESENITNLNIPYTTKIWIAQLK